jgi:hypothetical protein
LLDALCRLNHSTPFDLIDVKLTGQNGRNKSVVEPGFFENRAGT